MSASYFFTAGTRAYKAARRAELSQQRASAAASARYHAEKMRGPGAIPRPAAAMQGHALALSFRQAKADRSDAERMAVFIRLREHVNARARIMLLSGLAGGLNIHAKG